MTRRARRMVVGEAIRTFRTTGSKVLVQFERSRCFCFRGLSTVCRVKGHEVYGFVLVDAPAPQFRSEHANPRLVRQITWLGFSS